VRARRVGVVGLGRTGAAMARRLRGAGVDVVAWDASRPAVDASARAFGVAVGNTPRDVASGSDVVLQSLVDDADVLAVASGPDGVLAGLRSGAILIEMSLVGPATIGTLAAAVTGTGASLLDAQISGDVTAGVDGAGLILVGGEDAPLQAARWVLDLLGDRVIHVGGSGTGAAMRLLVDGVVHALNVALSESLVVAERSGVDRVLAWDMLGASAGGAPFVALKRAAFLEPASAETVLSLDAALRGLTLVGELADRLGVDAEQTRANTAIVARAAGAGHGDRDLSWLAQIIREAAVHRGA
jgi:3-hydroxyisobutyrate dehydrogenase-like beta-hydroxyacid dehydrogenase